MDLLFEQDKLFRLKRFTLSQQNCAMRIGTDGLLLGAWAGRDLCTAQTVRRILDIGCGCGLIALMCAQHYVYAQVCGLEIEPAAARTAAHNASASPFADRVHILCGDACDYSRQLQDTSYDLIISNPPYFKDSIPSPNDSRSRARHQANGFGSTTLFLLASQLLDLSGILCLITPYEQRSQLTATALSYGLRPLRLLPVQTIEDKNPKRLLSAWGKSAAHPLDRTTIESEALVIRSSNGSYSQAYLDLTAPFHPWIDEGRCSVYPT